MRQERKYEMRRTIKRLGEEFGVSLDVNQRGYVSGFRCGIGSYVQITCPCHWKNDYNRLQEILSRHIEINNPPTDALMHSLK